MSSPNIAEASYPITFRKLDAKILGNHLKLRHSVELIGMKRVGISNFLRFFLNHKSIKSKYISKNEKHLFVTVDLNDLVEREQKPFWILTLKRLADAAEESNADPELKQKISSYFLQSIQLQDSFLTIENIKRSLILLMNENFIPTLFLLRFDRMKEAATPEFFTNLQGLIDATNQQLAYVFTSVRPLDQIRPDIFTREELSTFSHLMYLMPAEVKDTEIVYDTILSKYNIHHSKKIKDTLVKLSGGHMQYLYLGNIILYEKLNGKKIKELSEDKIKELLLKDERVKFQSEEIFESLTKDEKNCLKKYVQDKIKSIPQEAVYLNLTGIVGKDRIFSMLFESYLLHTSKTGSESVDFSKKENQLYTLLLENINEICERDTIISAVWPEYEDLGVSDWTIDRLVARLRQKLNSQNSPYSIVTVKTRGYKLVQS